jgi:hypothetical protein
MECEGEGTGYRRQGAVGKGKRPLIDKSELLPMSDEQTKLLREILAELKANGDATAKSRAEVQAASASERAVADAQRTAWFDEVKEQKLFRARNTRLHRGMLLILLIGVLAATGIFAWSVRQAPRFLPSASPELESIEHDPRP